MRRFGVGLLIVVSALCLLVSSTSLWTRRNVVNTEVFVGNTETMIHAPAVTARVTSAVTAEVMANPNVQQAIDSAMQALPPGLQRFRPTVQDGIRSLVSAGVNRLLTSNVFDELTTAALTNAHNQLIAGKPVAFTLGQAKDLVPAGSQDGLAGQVLALVPNDLGITVVTPASAPRLYNAIDLLKTLWLWVGLVSAATLAGALALSRRRRQTLRAWSVTLSVLLLVELAVLRLVRGPLLSAVKPVNRDAVSAMWAVIAGSLRSWTLWLLAFTLVVLLVTILWGHVGLVPGIRRGFRSARASIRERRQARAVASAAAAGGQADGVPVEVPAESWPRRLAADTRAFADGLDMDRRSAALGAFVREHLRTARWTGIAIGALLLLFWPSPNLSVLIWVGALVALYLGALEWLQGRAPEAAEEEPEPAVAPPVAGVLLAATPDGAAVLAAPPAGQPEPTGAVPAPRASSEPLTTERLADLSERLDLVVRLGSARDSGVITDDEFAREKARVMPG